MSNAFADTAHRTLPPLAAHLAAAELDELADRLQAVGSQVDGLRDIPNDARHWIVLQLGVVAGRISRAAEGIDRQPAVEPVLDLEPFRLIAPAGTRFS